MCRYQLCLKSVFSIQISSFNFQVILITKLNFVVLGIDLNSRRKKQGVSSYVFILYRFFHRRFVILYDIAYEDENASKIRHSRDAPYACLFAVNCP